MSIFRIMWPTMLDMTRQESKSMLKTLEKEAYSGLISAFRAQGNLSEEKIRLIREIKVTLNISQNSHKAEVRRAVNDEKLRTIAYILTGGDTTDDWAMEGRRLIPLIPRTAPQTAYSTIADDLANSACSLNELLPLPAQTERKRTTLQPLCNESPKNLHYRGPPDNLKHVSEEMFLSRKRKLSYSEPTQLAQHLMGPPKVSRVQHLYRQKTKGKTKDHPRDEMPRKAKQQQMQQQQQQQQQQQEHVKLKHEHRRSYSLQKEEVAPVPNTAPPQPKEVESRLSPIPGCSTEPATKFRTHPVAAKPQENPEPKTAAKTTASRKPVTPKLTTQQTQKVLIVSNAQSTTPSSILQRSLQGIKTMEKVKLISTTSISAVGTGNLVTTSLTKPMKTVTMRTNATQKKLNIPILHGVNLQQFTGGKANTVKMIPAVSGKGAMLRTTISSGTTPIYVMNTIANVEALTKATSSANSALMAVKPQEIKDEKRVIILKNEVIKSADKKTSNAAVQNSAEEKPKMMEAVRPKVILKDPVTEIQIQDIESEITKLTEIPQTKNEDADEIVQRKQAIEESRQSEEFPAALKEEFKEEHAEELVMEKKEAEAMEEAEKEEAKEIEGNGDGNEEIKEEVMEDDGEYVAVFHTTENAGDEGESYVILEENPEILLCQYDEQNSNPEIFELMETLEPEPGHSSMEEIPNVHENEETTSEVAAEAEEEGYVILDNDSALNMPSPINLNE